MHMRMHKTVDVVINIRQTKYLKCLCKKRKWGKKKIELGIYYKCEDGKSSI